MTVNYGLHQISIASFGIAQIIKVANMFETHLTGIVNAMTYNKSNAMAERLNGKIQE